MHGEGNLKIVQYYTEYITGLTIIATCTLWWGYIGYRITNIARHFVNAPQIKRAIAQHEDGHVLYVLT